MQFVWPIKADYRISYLSDDYGQTVIAREARDYVWIMARAPQLSEADYTRLTDFVAAMGYDVSKLRKVPQRWPRPARHRLAARHPVRRAASRLPGCDLDRLEPVCRGASRRPLRGANVRDHSLLPPLFLASRVPHVAWLAVRVCRARRLRRAARAVVVGCAPSPSPRALRPARRRPLGPAGRLPAKPHGLVPGARELRHAHAPGPRPRALSRAPLARPLRRGRAGCTLRGTVDTWRVARGRPPVAGHQRLAARRMGLLHLDRRAVPLDFRHQLAGALLGHATLRDER